jgi:protein O-mannosyl-transferase
MAESEKNKGHLAALLVILAATAAVYLRTAWFPFCAVDDHIYVTHNAPVLRGLSPDSLKWAFTTFHAANWHPVTWLSLMLDGQLSGLNPAGYHLANTALHAINAALLYLLLYSMTGALGRSAFAAAFFALHPMHVESVAWIAERKDVLSTLFLLLALICYLEWARKGKGWGYCGALAAAALGLMAKPMLVTLPLLLLLLDFWPLRRLGAAGTAARPGLKGLLLEKLPFFLLSALSAVVTVIAQRSGGAVASLTHIPLPYRAWNALWSTLLYLVKSLLPFDLAVYYPFAQIPAGKAALAALVVGAVTVAVLKAGSRRGYLFTGWFWFLVTLLPVIGLVQVGGQAMADRYTYVPYIGLSIMLAWGGSELAERVRLPAAGLCGAAAALLLFFSGLTWHQLGYWQDNRLLLNHTIDVTQENYFAHFALGGHYDEQGKLDLAIEEYQKVLYINPNAKGVHLYYGVALAKQGRAEEAIPYLQEALRRDNRSPSGHFHLGTSLEKLGREAEAAASYAEAVRLDPSQPRYRTNYGSSLARQGRLDEAIEMFSRALELNPKDRKAAEYLQFARSLKERGRGSKRIE